MSGGKSSKQVAMAAGGHGSQSLLSKMLTADEDTVWQKSEVMLVMHWCKQIIAVVTAIIAGLVPLEGLFGIVLFLGCIAAIPVAVCRSVLKIDEEEFGGMQEILLEGAPFASGLFALLWIFTFNLFHVL
jgi:hypothetical protein